MSELHSIHCRGYRGVGKEWDDDDCDCGATIRNLRERLSECQHLQHDMNTIYTVANLTKELEEARAAAEAELDALRSRCICELADDDDEASHECGWQVCGVCWNNAAMAHKKVAEQLQAQLAAAEAHASHLRVQLLSANRTCEMFVDEYDRSDGTTIAPTPELIDLARFHKGQLLAKGSCE